MSNRKRVSNVTPAKFSHEITWSQFEICNPNTREAFEKLSRVLFNDFFFGGRALLHSDPNNPGVEVVPIFHDESKKMISFQSKYFDSMDYDQIKESAKKTVKYYTGNLDIVYLYCNKDVTVTSKGYQAAIDILASVGIELVPITNQTIIEQVMKNDTICWHFFDQFLLSDQWFRDHLETSLISLGPRYNSEFNVVTQTEELFDCFLCNQASADRINRNKSELIANLTKDKTKYLCCKKEYREIVEAIKTLQDISTGNILDCLTWSDILNEKCEDTIRRINSIIEKKKEELTVLYAEPEHQKVSRISGEIDALSYLMRVPQIVMPEFYPRNLIQNQILVIRGEAGAGKSQMMAAAAEKLIHANCGVILLLGASYINDHIFDIQTAEILRAGLSLDALMHKLEGVALENGTYSYIFIDAINESTYKSVWQTGLQSLFAKMPRYPHIKLALSVRSGYEKLVFDDTIRTAITDGALPSIVHSGFREESVEATLTFLNHYGIPFLPSYFLRAEMTNPLFLTIFCKTYSGENFDMFSLFDKLIEKADFEAQTAVGIIDRIPLLGDLIDEIAGVRLATGALTISRADLFSFSFWDRYGLSTRKIPFISSLVRSGFLISTVLDDEESYYLGYNLLEDFVCAKTIIKRYRTKDELETFLVKELLKIEDGSIYNYQNLDIFIVVCGLFAAKHHVECFEDIERYVTDEMDKGDISRRYIGSFVWRTATSVNAEDFESFIKNRPVDRDLVFRVLIENSAKDHHPLNSLFLHKLLIDKKLAHRDALWTEFANHLVAEDERVFQLISYFDKGNMLDGLSRSNTELLLIMFVWLLTSSNRFLRDKASKAAIELLRCEFSLCKPLLQRFEAVNDPYVVQRLYGIVFGACVKRIQEDKETFKALSAYVYTSVFDQEYVYPDILLRDYARLILERWIYEYPTDREFIVATVITPPYNSVPIPFVERQQYYDRDSGNEGFNSIDLSMRINHADSPGMYGDFGRYTFQAALSSFENVDVVNLYHYAMQFIRDELGYDELLGEVDATTRYYRYSRHDMKKLERIGKKYQWIAFYNILARISDAHLLKDWDGPARLYEGPWDPYVRDFDPTLNTNFLISTDIPNFSLETGDPEFLSQDPTPEAKEIMCWTQTKPENFSRIPSTLLIKDAEGCDWFALHLYSSYERQPCTLDDDSIGIKKGTQIVWSIATAYVVKSNQIDSIVEHIKSKQFARDRFPLESDVYELFSREYTWAPGYKSIFKNEWVDFEIETGKYHIEMEVVEVPDFEHMSTDPDGNITIPTVKKAFEQKRPDDSINVQIMPASSRVLWEAEYDASQEEATSFYIPCGALINHLKLQQKQNDGHYYSEDGTLVCFDSNLDNLGKGLLIRADYLIRYLQENGVRLLWTCVGEKQYFEADLKQKWSNWKGYFIYEKNEVSGEFECYK